MRFQSRIEPAVCLGNEAPRQSEPWNVRAGGKNADRHRGDVSTCENFISYCPSCASKRRACPENPGYKLRQRNVARCGVKAVVANGHGAPDVLSVCDIDTPEPKGRQVLVRVRACGVCRRDILVRRGPSHAGLASPLVLGHEIAGEVTALGPEARGFAVGDRVCSTQREFVCGCCRMCRTDRETLCSDLRFLGQESLGGYAEFVVVGDDNLAKLPAEVDFATGAIVACPVGTSYNAVCDTGRVQPGEQVLISGAGGLGTHAVQIARAAGAFVVMVTRSPDKVSTLEKLGAHKVVVATNGRFAAGVRQATGGRGVDVAIDTVGGAVFQSNSTLNGARRSNCPGRRGDRYAGRDRYSCDLSARSGDPKRGKHVAATTGNGPADGRGW